MTGKKRKFARLKEIYDEMQKCVVIPMPTIIEFQFLLSAVCRIDIQRVLGEKALLYLQNFCETRWPNCPQEIQDLLEVIKRVLAEIRDELACAEMTSQRNLPHPRYLSQIETSHKERTRLRPTGEQVNYTNINGVNVDLTKDLETQYVRQGLGVFNCYKRQYGYNGQKQMSNVMYQLNLTNLQRASTPRGLNKLKKRGRGRGGTRGRGKNHNFRQNNYQPSRERGHFNTRAPRGRRFGRGGRGRGRRKQGYSNREVATMKKYGVWLPFDEFMKLSKSQRINHQRRQRDALKNP